EHASPAGDPCPRGESDKRRWSELNHFNGVRARVTGWYSSVTCGRGYRPRTRVRTARFRFSHLVSARQEDLVVLHHGPVLGQFFNLRNNLGASARPAIQVA